MFSDKAKSYLVENSVKITVRTEQEFQAVANVVDTMADVRYLGIEFEPADKEAVKAKALAEACDKASAKRKLFEEKFGIKLVPQKLSEGTRLDQARMNQAAMRAQQAVGIQGNVAGIYPSAPSLHNPSGWCPVRNNGGSLVILWGTGLQRRRNRGLCGREMTRPRKILASR